MLMSLRNVTHAALLLALMAITETASATDGYFSAGYGVKAQGIGGAGVAFPQDSLAPATNPAGDAFIGNRFDLGLTYFEPHRGASLGPDEYDGDVTSIFLIPEGGFNLSLGHNLTFGVAVFGNGGLNTDYTTSISTFGKSTAGVDLQQIFATPTLTFKITDDQAIGISGVAAYERFKAHGLENFGVPDAGYSSSFGGGVRVGYTGKFFNFLTFGATYQSRVYMSRFSEYSGLFADHGAFDIPSNYAAGVAAQVGPKVTLAFDAERINFHEVAAVGADLDGASFASGLGSRYGPGFGWNDVTALKTGVSWDATDFLTLRAGYNYSTQPIPTDQTFLNILATAVVQHHVTAGVTWKVSHNLELSAFYAHAFEESVRGVNNFNGGNANIHLSEDSFGLALGWTF